MDLISLATCEAQWGISVVRPHLRHSGGISHIHEIFIRNALFFTSAEDDVCNVTLEQERCAMKVTCWPKPGLKSSSPEGNCKVVASISLVNFFIKIEGKLRLLYPLLFINIHKGNK